MTTVSPMPATEVISVIDAYAVRVPPRMILVSPVDGSVHIPTDAPIVFDIFNGSADLDFGSLRAWISDVLVWTDGGPTNGWGGGYAVFPGKRRYSLTAASGLPRNSEIFVDVTINYNTTRKDDVVSLEDAFTIVAQMVQRNLTKIDTVSITDAIQTTTGGWTTYDLPGAPRGIAGTAYNDTYVVGDDGMIMHFNGESWTAQVSGTTQDLLSITSPSAGVAFACGKNETILKTMNAGATWAPVTIATTGAYPLISRESGWFLDFQLIHAINNNDYYVADSKDCVFYYTSYGGGSIPVQYARHNLLLPWAAIAGNLAPTASFPWQDKIHIAARGGIFYWLSGTHYQQPTYPWVEYTPEFSWDDQDKFGGICIDVQGDLFAGGSTPDGRALMLHGPSRRVDLGGVEDAIPIGVGHITGISCGAGSSLWAVAEDPINFVLLSKRPPFGTPADPPGMWDVVPIPAVPGSARGLRVLPTGHRFIIGGVNKVLVYDPA